MNRRRPGQSRTGASRSEFHLRPSASAPPAVIPLWWLSSVIGFFLLPVAWVSTKTFFDCTARATFQHHFWATEEFWFFSLGAILWLIAFFGLPRPLWIYVFGHELTHALWVWIMGGRVSRFHVSSAGGHIVSDKHNFWIALAPYFFPLYSIAVIALFGAGSLVWNLEPYHRWLYALIGVTWAFHVSFSLWMIPKGQTDLSYYGTFFSLVIIYLMNLLVLTVLVVIASPHVTCRALAHDWLENARLFSETVVRLAALLRHRFL